MNVELKPYDEEVQDAVFRELFCKGRDREDGLKEIPAESYQLVVSALEWIRWECSGDDREVLLQATGIVKNLRNEQKIREWRRARS